MAGCKKHFKPVEILVELRETIMTIQLPPLRSLWIMLEAPEVIELKRIGIDRDRDETVAFFKEVLMPRVRTAVRKHGIAVELFPEDKNLERLPG